ncbi:MAG: hypothetical protein V1728_01955 [Candidatus Micrarchaeota archaeon]
MGWQDWLKKETAAGRASLHSSQDFRKKRETGDRKASTRPEPSLPPLTTPIALPLLGPVRAYYLLLALAFILYVPLHNSSIGILVGLLGGATLVFSVLWEFYLSMNGKLDEWKETLAGLLVGILAWFILGQANAPDSVRLIVPCLAVLLFVILLEKRMGRKSEGMLNEMREMVYAILLAVLVWYGAGWLLATPTPINAIVSCSMLPSHERGDMVLLQGGPVRTALGEYGGPASDINASAIVRAADGPGFAVMGSVLNYCFPLDGSRPECNAFMQDPRSFVEAHGPLEITYDYCDKRYFDARKPDLETICASGARINGEAFGFDPGHELIVYSPKPSDLYAQVGDIVHRAAFALDTTTGTAYFTKGDNNQLYDFQAYDKASGEGNSPVLTQQIKGRVIVRIPYIGNLKLFISPQVVINPAAMAGCDGYLMPRLAE